MPAAAVISDDYRRVQNQLHAANPGYGVMSVLYAPTVAKIVNGYAVNSLLDYGAGKGRLGMELVKLVKRPLRITPYDPAIPGWDGEPLPDEMVCCIDVLEHIEPDRLDAVLDDLARLTRRVGFFTVHTGPAERILPDGRNAHLIQEKAAWWLPRILARFELQNYSRQPNGFSVLVTPAGGSLP